MIACPRPARSSCEGLTALETAVVLFITAIVAVPLLATAGWVVALPVEWRANVEAARDARKILRQVADDARQASSFSTECDRETRDLGDVPEEPSECWTFTWNDYTARCFLIVRYSYREDGAVVRGETINELEEDVTAGACKLLGALQFPEEGKTIGSVDHFEIGVTPIPNGDNLKCLIGARVRLSRSENFRNPEMDIAAMMRPDNVEC